MVDLNVTPTTSADSPSDQSINYVSPFVSTTRGKVSARKERKQRESVYKLDPSCTSMNERPIADVETRRRRETALYFRKQIDDESNRLLALADTWQRHKEEFSDQMISEYVDLINVTIDQTRLLLSKKFRQFRDLIDRCESGTGEQIVLACDLEGFWSMLYVQVEQCNARFERLDILKASEWKEAEDIASASKSSNIRMLKKTVIPHTKNGILDLLKASRAKFQEEMLKKRMVKQKTVQVTPR